MSIVIAKPAAIESIEHITRAGERWDTIAWAYYGDANAISRLVEANPALDLDTVLESGQRLIVPLITLEEVEAVATAELSSKLPPWKR